MSFDAFKFTFVTASKDCTAKLVDADTLQVLKTYSSDKPVQCAVISPYLDHILLAGGEDSQNVTVSRDDISQFRVRFYHKIYENEIGSVIGHFGTVNTLAITPDGKS